MPGGTVPSGRISVRAEPDDWRLVPDPDYAAVAAGLVRRCVADDSSGMPSRWLSAAGIPRHVNTVSPVPEAHRGLVIRVVMLG